MRASRELGTKLYGVIYADLPRRFEVCSEGNGSDRTADNYTTVTIDEIAEIELPAASNGVLFLWTTVPLLKIAIDLMGRWNFEYKSACTGFWFGNELEMLLIGTRGNVPAPPMGKRLAQAINPGKPSEQLDRFADMIAAMFPNVPKLEMFARKRRDGWDVGGNQVEPQGISGRLLLAPN